MHIGGSCFQLLSYHLCRVYNPFASLPQFLSHFNGRREYWQWLARMVYPRGTLLCCFYDIHRPRPPKINSFHSGSSQVSACGKN